MKTATQEGPATVPASDLVHISGKTFTVAGTPFGIRGVRYGTFLPRADGKPFPSASDVQRDFAAIRERGLNAVRIYHVPPHDVLEAAEAAGLRLLVDLTAWVATCDSNGDTGARNGWCPVGIGSGSIDSARRGGRVFSIRLHGCVGRCSDPCSITATSAWHPFKGVHGGELRLPCNSAPRCCRSSYLWRSSA
jgi:hypothetical protein